MSTLFTSDLVVQPSNWPGFRRFPRNPSVCGTRESQCSTILPFSTRHMSKPTNGLGPKP
jgi:hypothetical protein